MITRVPMNNSEHNLDIQEFLDEIEENKGSKQQNKVSSPTPKSIPKNQLAPGQKFILSLMTFFLILVGGVLTLLITGKIFLPI